MHLEAVDRMPVLRRWIPSLRKLFHVLFERRVGLYRRYGLTFLLDYRNVIDRSLILRFDWEGLQFDELNRLADGMAATRRMFLDIGSHWGLYAIRATVSGRYDEIIAFEPDRRNLNHLGANLMVNDLNTAIDVHAIALSDFNGDAPFALAPDSGPGGSRVSTDSAPDGWTETRVRCCRMDELVAAENALLVCKIDVEGHELAVLRGMEGLFPANDFVLQIEAHDTFEAVRQYLQARGFRYVGSFGRGMPDHFFVKD